MESKKRMTTTRTIKHWATGPKLESGFAYFCSAFDCVGSAWSFVISHPNTTANEFRLRRISIPYIIHYFFCPILIL